jgi:hypothetical protein
MTVTKYELIKHILYVGYKYEIRQRGASLDMTGLNGDGSRERENMDPLNWPSERAEGTNGGRITTIVEEEMNVDTMSVNRVMLNNQFSIPEYQRGFAWDEGNIEEFWQEVVHIVEADTRKEVVSDLFMGSIFLVEMADDENRQEVIDGQQRITTFTLLIKVLLDELENIGDLEDSGLRDLVDRLTGGGLESYIYPHMGTNPKLQLSTHNNDFYKALFTDDDALVEYIQNQPPEHWAKKHNAIEAQDFLDEVEVVDSSVENNRKFGNSNNRLLKAYTLLRENVRRTIEGRSQEQRATALVNLTIYFLFNFHVTVFHIPEGHPTLMMQIFQTLNDRGMELAQVDIIRARIATVLTQLDDEDERKHILDEWEGVVDQLRMDHDVITDYLVEFMLVFHPVPESFVRSDVKKHLMSAFSDSKIAETARLTNQLETAETTKQFVGDLNSNVNRYYNLRNPGDQGLHGLNAAVNRDAKPVLERLSMLRTSQWRALAFLAYAKVDGLGAGPQKKFLEILRTIESLTIRQVLLGLNPNDMERVYQTGVRALKDDDLDAVIPALVGAFRQSYPGAVGQTFALSLIQNISHSSRHLRALYFRITTSNDKHKGMFRNELDKGSIHVEHIVPQTPLLSSAGENRYTWLEAFFSAGVDEEVSEFIGELIQDGADDTLVELMEAVVVDDYANVCLLLDQVNEHIQNSPFDMKVPHYMLTEGFSLATVNSYLSKPNLPAGIEPAAVRTAAKKLLDDDDFKIEKVADWIRDLLKKEGLNEETGEAKLRDVVKGHEPTNTGQRAIRDWWNVESFKERKLELTKIILEDIRLDSEEFEGVELSAIIDDDIRKRLKLFMIENGWDS